MSGIFGKIEQNYDKFTKLEKRVADVVFENPQKVLYTSITDLAEMCGVGDTTVFRFCKALKLNGYQDFKMLLAQDIANTNGVNNILAGAIDLEDDVKTICEKALTTNIAALNETFNLLDFNAVSKAVELMSSAKRIHFFGMGSSGLIALEAKHKFMRIMPNVEFVSDCHMQYMAASLLGGNDLAIFISYSGSTKDMIEMQKIAKQNGCKTICITRYARSPITNFADLVLQCGSNEGPLDGGASSTIMVQLYIIDVLYLQYFIKHNVESRINKSKTTESISSKLL
ncbi:MAG: transcriptional regulator, RpiR family [Anaerocolumna sp.]|jgi:DNA-binding MurR/RpiR family transcriptional regulator|nr:transcriptional regulator, RpiR family [Anaerocolumna sp.]